MKFCQFIEYDIRNIFLEQSYIKFGDDTSPKLFSKKSKLGISLGQQSEILFSLLLLYVQLED